MPTVTAYAVVADVTHATADGPRKVPHDLGLFFKVTDADKFVSGLASGWGTPRIETRAVPVEDIHEAHRALFPEVFKQSAKK